MNRVAVVSVFAGVLTILSFCLGAFPIPLTGIICFPTAVALGIVAAATGLHALRQTRRTGQKGGTFALAGVWIGGLTTAAALCALLLGVALLPGIAALIRGVGH